MMMVSFKQRLCLALLVLEVCLAAVPTVLNYAALSQLTFTFET